jgi:hypothetical protein
MSDRIVDIKRKNQNLLERIAFQMEFKELPSVEISLLKVSADERRIKGMLMLTVRSRLIDTSCHRKP